MMIPLAKANKLFLSAYLLLVVFITFVIVFTEKGALLLWWNNHQSSFQTSFFKLLTYFGEVGAYLLAILGLIFFSYKHAIIVAVSGLTALPVVQLLKHFFSYPRPIKYFQNLGFGQIFERLEGVDWLTGSNSFPSGHTTAAFALMAVLSFSTTKKNWAVLWLLPAILVGCSRIYLRHHFLEDVFFGSALGVLIAFLVFSFFNRKQITIMGKTSILK